MNISKIVENYKINQRLHEILYIDTDDKVNIEWGMNYVLFLPSKRVRPLLLLKSAELFTDSLENAYYLAAAVELIHTYSLVHDDLPAMDNDDLRRGKPTLHTIYNEAYAILVGDALLSRVLEILSKYNGDGALNKILAEVSRFIGYRGMIRGQLLDMESEGNKNISKDEILKINYLKTSNLLQLSLILGGIHGGADDKELDLLSNLGGIMGHIFQIKDDLLDIQGDAEVIGKEIGSDEKNDKSSIPLIIGVDESVNMINNFAKEAGEIIEKLPGDKNFFYEFISFLKNRVK